MVIKGGFQGLERRFKLRSIQADQDTIVGIFEYIFERQITLALNRPALAEREKTRELTKSFTVTRISEQLGSIRELQPGRHEIAQAKLLGSGVPADNPGKRIRVRNGEPLKAQLTGAGHQFFSVRGPGEEGKIADREELDIAHGNSPATYQSSVSSPG